MNVYKAIVPVVIIIVITANSGCGRTGGTDYQDLLVASELISEPVLPVEPDSEYTESDCGCGVKSSESSSKADSQSNSISVYAEEARINTYRNSEILVRFKQGISSIAIDRVTRSFGGSRIKNLMNSSHGTGSLIARIKVGDSMSVQEAVAAYRKDTHVEYAQPNFVYHAFALPDDPNFPDQWGLHNAGQNINGSIGTPERDIHASEAWELVHDCSGVIIAVIDTGINYNHRDLSASLWSGGPTYPNHGYDFVDDDNDPMDFNGHGTHVAGIISAGGNDATGLSGVCWKCQLMGVRVLDASGEGTTETVVEGINFAINNGAHIINLSLGNDSNDAILKSAIIAARNSGVIVVASAGNNGSTTKSYPAAYASSSVCTNCDNVLSVAAIDQKGNLAEFSSYGTDWVDIAAPGVNILSTWPGQSVTTRENFGDWVKERDWGDGTYYLHGPFGPVAYTLLTNPGSFGRRWYGSNIDSAAYKVFDLGAYGAVSATAGFYFDFDIDYSDSLDLAVGLNGTRPDLSESLLSISGWGYGFIYAGSFDLTRFINENPGIGFLFQSDDSWEGYGIGIGLYETTRLYLNTTACRYLAGTSMAAPYVSGTAALCIAQFAVKYGSYVPQDNYMQIINSLLNNYDSYSWLSSKVNNGRMLNAYKAVQGM